jgi:hypothetical protein
MAMDYLPIQATSMPCEHVFLSAKETDTAKRNWISPALMEALQLLKFSLKKEWLNFIKGWSTPETAMSGELSKRSEVHLGSLFSGDPNAVMDDMLNQFSTYDCDC